MLTSIEIGLPTAIPPGSGTSNDACYLQNQEDTQLVNIIENCLEEVLWTGGPLTQAR